MSEKKDLWSGGTEYKIERFTEIKNIQEQPIQAAKREIYESIFNPYGVPLETLIEFESYAKKNAKKVIFWQIFPGILGGIILCAFLIFLSTSGLSEIVRMQLGIVGVPALIFGIAFYYKITTNPVISKFCKKHKCSPKELYSPAWELDIGYLVGDVCTSLDAPRFRKEMQISMEFTKNPEIFNEVGKKRIGILVMQILNGENLIQKKAAQRYRKIRKPPYPPHIRKVLDTIPEPVKKIKPEAFRIQDTTVETDSMELFVQQIYRSPASIHIKFTEIPDLLESLTNSFKYEFSDKDLQNYSAQLDKGFTFTCCMCKKIFDPTAVITPANGLIMEKASSGMEVVSVDPQANSVSEEKSCKCGSEIVIAEFYPQKVDPVKKIVVREGEKEANALNQTKSLITKLKPGLEALKPVDVLSWWETKGVNYGPRKPFEGIQRYFNSDDELIRTLSDLIEIQVNKESCILTFNRFDKVYAVVKDMDEDGKLYWWYLAEIKKIRG